MEVLLCGQCEYSLRLSHTVLCIYMEKSLTSHHLLGEWGHMSNSQTKKQRLALWEDKFKSLPAPPRLVHFLWYWAGSLMFSFKVTILPASLRKKLPVNTCINTIYEWRKEKNPEAGRSQWALEVCPRPACSSWKNQKAKKRKTEFFAFPSSVSSNCSLFRFKKFFLGAVNTVIL